MAKYNLFFVVILFLLIYEPPISSVNILHIIGGFSWLYIIINYKNVAKVIKIDILIKIYIILIVFWIYLLLIVLFNGNSILNTFSFVYWIIDILPASVMLTIHFSKKDYTLYNFINILLLVGLIQGLCALGAFLIPSIKEFFVNQLIYYGYSDNLLNLSDFRMFGYSSNLTFSTPVVQSVLAAISIYLAINKNIRYILFTPLLIFSAIINARTSLVIIGVAIIAMLIVLNKIRVKKIARLFIIGILLYSTIFLGISLLKKESYDTFQWIEKGYIEITDFFQNDPAESNGYFAYISESNRYDLPDGLGMLFGVGDRILGINKYNTRSDIGYINDIWLGGIFYSLFLYSLFAVLLSDIAKIKTDTKITNFLFYLLLGTFIVTNVKGYVFVMNNLTNLLFIIYTFLVVNKNRVPLMSNLHSGTKYNRYNSRRS